MKRSWRIGVIFSLVSFLLGGISFACPRWTERMGLDFWNLPALESELEQEVRYDRALEKESESVRRRVQIRCDVTQDVINDAITVESAVNEFLELNQADQEGARAVRRHFDGATLLDSTCRQLVSFVDARLVGSPEHDATVARVRREIRAYRERRASQL